MTETVDFINTQFSSDIKMTMMVVLSQKKNMLTGQI